MEKVLARAQMWVSDGVAPPKTHVRSLYLAAFLLVFGFGALAIAGLSFMEIALDDLFTSPATVFGISALALVPGGYVGVLAFLAWRRLGGVTWADVPYVQTY